MGTAPGDTLCRICGLNQKDRREERVNSVTADKTVDIYTFVS